METLRLPGDLRECERAAALDRNLSPQACSQQRTPARDRGPQAGEHEPASGQVSAQGRLHPSLQQGLQCMCMIRRSVPRQDNQALAPGSTQAALSMRMQPAGSRRALLAKLVEEDFQNFCPPGETLRRRCEHIYASASAQKRRVHSPELKRGAMCSAGAEKCGSRASQCDADCSCAVKCRDASSARHASAGGN